MPDRHYPLCVTAYSDDASAAADVETATVAGGVRA